MSYTPEQIKERYEKLPPDIKEAMDSIDTTNTIVDIGQKHDLMFDQLSELVDEVGMVMVGLTPSVMFTNNIARRMKVDMGKAMLVTQDLNKEVFDKLRVSLKKIEEGHGENTEGYSSESGNVAPVENETDTGLDSQTGETTMTDAEKAQKESVVSAIERAGGFVIEKPNQAPLQAEGIVNNTVRENLAAMKNPTTKSQLSPNHLLSDTPETARGNIQEPQSPPRAPLEQTLPKQMPVQSNVTIVPTAQKPSDQTSIVDTLLSHGVAMSMDSTATKPEKPAVKVKPYDGTDPYREAVE